MSDSESRKIIHINEGRKKVRELLPTNDNDSNDDIFTHAEALYIVWKCLCAGSDLDYKKLQNRQFTITEIEAAILEGINLLNENVGQAPSGIISVDLMQAQIYQAYQAMLLVLGLHDIPD